MKTILISHPEFFDEEFSLLAAFFDEGLQYFHLRKPEADEKAMRIFIESLPKQYHNKLVLHNHFDLVREYGLKGVHFSQKTKHLIPTYENDCYHKSISTHTLSEIDEIQYLAYDYVFLSPVFDSISKPGYQAAIDLTQLVAWKKGRQLPFDLIALGGVDKEKITQVKAAGFEGVAILGAIWDTWFVSKSKELVTSRFKELLSRCQDEAK